MTIASISVLRQKLPPFLSTAFIHQQRFISAVQNPINARKQQQQKQHQPNKNVLRARETFKKQFSSLAPLLSPDEKPPLTDNQAIGTVVSSQANFMRVVVNSASQSEDWGSLGMELLCVVKEVLKKIKRRVLVGDRVLVGAIDWVDKGGRIENVFERKSEILDPPVANVDHLLVLFSIEQPTIEPFTLTRFLVEAESTGIPLTLALNKVELAEEGTLGSKWFEEQRVGEVSTRSGRGKHTTRNVSLLPLSGGGYLADTPGFNQPSLMKVTKQSLAQYFPEIRKMLEQDVTGKCSFSDCLHIGEPGCLVKGDWERFSYYVQLLDEIKVREEFQLRTFGTKRESGVRLKVGGLGVKQAEPRLEPKKHRRQSRKTVNQSILDELDDDDDDNETLDSENPILRAMKDENK
ncbi:small ribosomal subunit biogenesis GTPase RsgA 1, mitochondrial isoform X2 [Salvia miltiorrhiza]|uniref:small ribosomal subunit biogenesis GTPase RsgA 1, mitochondrial isoform X2 n=1 Tax=Salvia miltiorrhiza TaxID=226208 RepID=UPI0025AD15EE|nr:small ribosomal subunit biogenesis GTPase RsgA 1, mitochondrial isoform X2 [Salvia miltiorrhiza]